MKNKITLLLLVLIAQFSVAQNNERNILHGQVKNDSLAIESGYVLNINAHVRTLINKDGLFDIAAKSKDTLVFSGMVFQSKKVILTPNNFLVKVMVVPLDLINNQLKEVIIPNELKVKSLEGGSQRIVDGQYFDDALSTPENQVAYSDQTIKYGMDFVRMFKEVRKALKGKPEEGSVYVEDIAFSEYAQANFKPSFFENELKLKEDEIDLFLMYCSNDKESRRYLGEEDKFQLMDFLINKNKDFKRITTFEK